MMMKKLKTIITIVIVKKIHFNKMLLMHYKVMLMISNLIKINKICYSQMMRKMKILMKMIKINNNQN